MSSPSPLVSLPTAESHCCSIFGEHIEGKLGIENVW